VRWRAPIQGRITLSGYEGSELLVARLLVESGADLRYVGTACPRTPWSEPTANGCKRAACMCSTAPALEQDLAAFHEFKPDLAIGTTPVVQAAKEARIAGAVLHQPDLGAPADGPGRCRSLAQVVNAAIGNKARFDAMSDFFGDVRAGRQAPACGSRLPADHPEFRAETRRLAEKRAKKRKAEEMV
jgi:chlorophyllide a reductase subunit Y